MERAIILHCHIFKNGGTTIDGVLKRNFGSSALFCEIPGDHFLSQEMLLDAAQGEGVKSISSHRIGLPPPESDVVKFIPLVMLREPLDRLGSMYSFYKRQEKDISHECALARRSTFKDFVRILMEAGLDVSFANIQAQFFLANLSPPQYPSQRNWDIVREGANSLPCIGVLELFDESLVLWERYLCSLFPDINLSYVRKNVSQDRPETLMLRLGRLREELGDELVREFHARNEFDYQLYDLVKYKILNNIMGQADFKEELADFRKRNAVLARGVSPDRSELYPHGGGDCGTNEDEAVSCLWRGREVNVSRVSSRLVSVGSSALHIIGCGLLDHSFGKRLTMVQHGQAVDLVIVVEAFEEVDSPIVGITVENSKQEIVFCMNSFVSHTQIASPQVGKHQAYSFSFVIPPLNSGSYSVCPAFASGTLAQHTVVCHVKDALLFFVPAMIHPRMPGSLYINDFIFQNI